MKKKYLLFLSTVLLLPLCACLNAIPELSEEDEAKVVRYMADVVLAHDQNYQARLLDEEEKQKALEEEAFKAEAARSAGRRSAADARTDRRKPCRPFLRG